MVRLTKPKKNFKLFHCLYHDNNGIIATIAIVSAFTSATLVTYFNYKFGIKTKKLDILFTNRLTAFKDIASKIILFKNFCTGKVSYLKANEYHHFMRRVLEHYIIELK